MKRFLHVGCGPARKADTTSGFQTPEWHEVRFDIDPSVEPDVIGTITDMTNVPTGSFDAIFSSHNIEHVYFHEVVTVFREFHRVLADDGFAVITCPDLQSVCAAVAKEDGGLLHELYDSPSGPVSAMDILYGHIGSVANGKHYMAHRCGFTIEVLVRCLREAGFKSLFGGARPKEFDLWEVAFKKEIPDAELTQRALEYLPR